MDQKQLSGFNTVMQKVAPHYEWINEMIGYRQELMDLYEQVCTKLCMKKLGIQKINAKDSNSAQSSQDSNDLTLLSDFCDHLIDYVSHGHFDLYPKILELVENASGRSLSIARRAMPAIEHTSDYLLRFNDIYSQDVDEEILKDLPQDLIKIKSCLQSRFRNEDRLIIGLRLVHAAVETPSF